jgi:hypothetical protein
MQTDEQRGITIDEETGVITLCVAEVEGWARSRIETWAAIEIDPEDPGAWTRADALWAFGCLAVLTRALAAERSRRGPKQPSGSSSATAPA